MTCAEASDECKVVCRLEDLFDFIELESTLTHVVPRVDGIFDERCWSLEDVAQEEQFRLEHVWTLSRPAWLATSYAILLLVEVGIVVHEAEKCFSQIRFSKNVRELSCLQKRNDH